jgi:hypothetical protein
MTLVLSEVIGLLAGAALWLGVAVALCAIPGLGIPRLLGERSNEAALRSAVIAGLLAAGLSARLGLSDPAGFEALRRPVPVLWILGGASLGAALTGLRLWRLSGRTEG